VTDKTSLSYKDAGVDIDAGNALVGRIKGVVKQTRRPEVMLYTLALLEPGNPAQRVVGWPNDLARYDAQSWHQYTQKFPAIRQIPILGNGNLNTINAEMLLPLKPDLVILPRLAKGSDNEQRLQHILTEAGIPYIYVDLRIELIKNTLPSLKLLGEVLNRPERAAAFSAFYQQHMDVIRDRLSRYQGKKTTVMTKVNAALSSNTSESKSDWWNW